MSNVGHAAASHPPSEPAPAARLCRCCGSHHVSLRGRKRGSFILREYEFHACADCGFIAVEPFSGYEIYNDAYYRGAGPDPYVDYEAEYHGWRTSDRLLEFEDLSRIAARYFASSAMEQLDPKPLQDPRPPDQRHEVTPDHRRWLDFGCGAGAFLKYLRSHPTLNGSALELTGHDVGSYADLLKTKDGFRILNLDELKREPDARFDVISMIEVIEHLPDPLEPLQLVTRLLKPGGLLLLTTGNLESPVARKQGIHYRYCAPEIHVSLFNPRCLSKLYQRVGLSPLAVRYHGAVKFKVLKSLRHRRALRAIAAALLKLPPFVRVVDRLYGVSAMPCAVKSETSNRPMPLPSP
jgi:2-polyprenyl-3-methyl-5-hydroxy-6-metoxy-1,4-benzoquinol methylase